MISTEKSHTRCILLAELGSLLEGVIPRYSENLDPRPHSRISGLFSDSYFGRDMSLDHIS